MSGWWLAVDFGTSFTTAAYRGPGAARAELLEIDGSRYLPSVVCLEEDGGLLVGRAAVSRATVFPERAERTPKRALVAGDQVRLGGVTVDTVRLVAAVLERVGEEARRRFGGAAPDGVVLTHPVRWGERELGLLASAAVGAGLPAPRFLPEPVAAARHYLELDTLPPGSCVAVYDLGGGTLDTAVLRRTPDGFDVVGQPGGNPHFGGEDLTNALFGVVQQHAQGMDAAAWEKIWTATGRTGLRAEQQWRAAINEAKELLSSSPTTTVFETGFESGLRVTRSEYEAVIDSMLRSSIYELRATMERAGTPPGGTAAIYLTGGASRTPKVSDLVAEIIGVLPTTSGDPKTAIVLGAIAALGPHLSATGGAGVPAPPPPVQARPTPPPVPRPATAQSAVFRPIGPSPFGPPTGPAARATTPGAIAPPAGLLSPRPLAGAAAAVPPDVSAPRRNASGAGPWPAAGHPARLRIWWPLCGVGTLMALALWVIRWIGLGTSGLDGTTTALLLTDELPLEALPGLIGAILLLRRARPGRQPVRGALLVIGCAVYAALRFTYFLTMLSIRGSGTFWLYAMLAEESLFCLLGLVCIVLACVDGTLRLRRPRLGAAPAAVLVLAMAGSGLYADLVRTSRSWSPGGGADYLPNMVAIGHMFTVLIILAVAMPLITLMVAPPRAFLVLALAWFAGICANAGFDLVADEISRTSAKTVGLGLCFAAALVIGLVHAVRHRTPPRQALASPGVPAAATRPGRLPSPAAHPARPPRRTRSDI